MKRVLLSMLLLLIVTACRTKKIENTSQRQVQKEHFVQYKDSSKLFTNTSHKSVLFDQSDESFELELESARDSLGNAKELTYTCTRDANRETIRVRNGKVKIKAIRAHSKSLQQADTTLYKQSYASAQTEVRKHEIQEAEQIRKHTQSKPLSYVLWLLLLVVLAYVYWRYKRFKQKI